MGLVVIYSGKGDLLSKKLYGIFTRRASLCPAYLVSTTHPCSTNTNKVTYGKAILVPIWNAEFDLK